jgi:hypothetical protein
MEELFAFLPKDESLFQCQITLKELYWHVLSQKLIQVHTQRHIFGGHLNQRILHKFLNIIWGRPCVLEEN